MQITTRLKIATQWFATGTLSALTIVFGINAGDIFFNHDGTTGQMRGYAAIAAISAFIAYQLYGMITEGREERQRARRNTADQIATVARDSAAILVAGSSDPLQLGAGGMDNGFVRVERPCPYCAEQVLAAARLCRFCHSELVPLVPVQGIDQTDARATHDRQAAHNTPH